VAAEGEEVGVDGQRPVGREPVAVIEVECPVRLALDEAPARDARPRQQVGMALDDRGRDDVVRLQAQPVGEVVARLRRVAADDRHVAGPRAAGEREDRVWTAARAASNR